MDDDDVKRTVREAFRPWENGDSGPFFALVADDVRWTVIGTTKVSGVYTSKAALLENTFGPLLDRLDGPLKTTFIDLAVDGSRVFLRFESLGTGKTGTPYRQTYCFAMRWRNGQIVETVAYLDTELLANIFADP
ncbi:MAG: nuclear transport factor 2 family protein [Pseudomonadota bacterium]